MRRGGGPDRVPRSTAPRWARALLGRLAPRERAEEVLGDLEEVHRERVRRRGRVVASVLSGLEALDVAVALTLERVRGTGAAGRGAPAAVAAPGARGAGARLVGARVSWLDFKLGFRMLVRYPGLTVVGGLAMAFAIWVGAGSFEFLRQVAYPTLPLDGGDRIVGLRLWDAASSSVEEQAWRDFVVWREELRSVEELGAFRTVERNLITAEGWGEPVTVAEISASAFRVARVRALLGRPLVDADEESGASPVVVLGYGVWQRRFDGDPAVVGRTVRLGSGRATVVGVMPEGFRFPISHGLWAPLRLDELDHGRREGPAINVFGRLAPGVTLDEAQAELATLGRRAASDSPDTHEHLRPQIMPYAQSILNISGLLSVGLMSINLFLVALLVLVCGNIALLMFARAATRESELVVRRALGASRRRIVGQLFAEALVLAVLAAVVGLAAAGFGLRWGLGIVESEILNGTPLPFWIEGDLSPTTVLYATALAVLAAGVAGVIPALRVTGRGVERRLRRGGAGGGGARLGGIWTAVLVTQVALTVAFPVVAIALQRAVGEIRAVELAFPRDEYLSARLELGRDGPFAPAAGVSRAASAERFRATYEELERRLTAEPAVRGVTFANRVPRMYHPWNQIEVDEGATTPLDSVRGHRVSNASIAVDYFDVLGVEILSGRGFHAADVTAGARVVIANESFVERVLGGRNPIGRRVRYIDSDYGAVGHREEEPWYEIVGVAPDLGMTSGYGVAGLYHPLARAVDPVNVPPPPGDDAPALGASTPRAAPPVHVILHVRGEPAAFTPRLRTLATAVEPKLQVQATLPLDQIDNSEIQFYAFWFRLSALLSSIALLLSLAGIYAVMSFAVSRRTREIGIRVALGSDPWRVVLAILRRPLAQVGLGVVAGAWLVGALGAAAYGDVSARGAAMVAAYAALMMGVCMLACIVPTRRALRIQPMEALTTD